MAKIKKNLICTNYYHNSMCNIDRNRYCIRTNHTLNLIGEIKLALFKYIICVFLV